MDINLVMDLFQVCVFYQRSVAHARDLGGIFMFKVVIWGMGGFIEDRRQQIEEISTKEDIVAFTDSTCKGDKLLWNRFLVVDCLKLKELEFDYVCISSSAEWEIRKKIYDSCICENARIITYNELLMLTEFKDDIDSIYIKLERALPDKIAEIMQERRIYRRLVNNYSWVIFDEKYKELQNEKKVRIPRDICPIWVFWDAGFGNAPEVVELCVESIREALSENEKMYFLDADNINEYICIPEYITEKWKKGIINRNKYANIIRLNLLNTYGGIWIDSTVYVMGDKLPDYLKRNKLFMYHIDINGLDSASPCIAANWIIASHGESLILKSLEALHYEYWKQENTECHYFFFHMFLTMAANYYKDEWNSMEIVLRDPAQLLCRYLSEKHDFNLIQSIKSASTIQKLSWKLEFDKYNENSLWMAIKGHNV